MKGDLSVTDNRLPLFFKRSPDVFMRPSYRISPFSTSDISRVPRPSCHLDVDRLFAEFFGRHEFSLTESGRMAIEIALEEIGVNKQDVVSIVTTTNNYYISSCVTTAIEKHCRWNRIIGPDTAVILVVHEFGCLYKTTLSLRKYGLPIIEDYAHSFASRFSPTEGFTERLIGDYAIFSLPKFIPIQFGGVLVSSKKSLKLRPIDKELCSYLTLSVADFLSDIKSAIDSRKKVYRLLTELFKTLEGTPFFDYSEGEVPGVFLFKINLTQEELQKLKIHTQAYGIESSVFYGENAFFIPCHQRLTSADIDYFYEVIAMFIKGG